MPLGSEPRFRPLRASSGTQTKMPELPAYFKWRHWATSSKFATCVLVRMTPTGLPVQWTSPPFHVQVLSSQLTLTKSSPVSCFQPRLSPSIKAFGAAGGSCADIQVVEKATAIATAAMVAKQEDFMIGTPGRDGILESDRSKTRPTERFDLPLVLTLHARRAAFGKRLDFVELGHGDIAWKRCDHRAVSPAEAE